MDAITFLVGLHVLIGMDRHGAVGAVKGILLAGVPGSELVDAAESLWSLYSLDGSYQRTIDISRMPRIALADLQLKDIEQLHRSVESLQAPVFRTRLMPDIAVRNFLKLGGADG